MIRANITLGKNVNIDDSTSINNVTIGDNVKISKGCVIFGSPEKILSIGDSSYVGMFSILNGFRGLTIGQRVSIAPRVTIISDSGPNASPEMQKVYPIIEGEVEIGDDSWIGINAIIMPGVRLGKFCVVAANSFVNTSFPDCSVIGGSPARLLKTIEIPE